ncbi:hypothetical protein GCM10010082_23430 [Kushneria pakistanensis]|uniref:Cyclase dehydrase n=1 Tax=Kushneria pakistanensis TaxID=1508770 RepID=A0ABQ3FLC3_9GAMM|nr:hypothetical protein [Kushneria pakistanensis]GHC29122.1 hypothetical protein GCM10010082_23430 [Kushneria pakistanensis]
MTTSHHLSANPGNHGGPRSMDANDRLARVIGWAGVGLGLAELFMPGRITRSLGIEGHENWVRACGVRQIVTGLGALSDNPAPALKLRVAGDALDLAALAWVRREPHAHHGNIDRAMLAVGACTALEGWCAGKLHRRHDYMGGVTPDYSDRSGFPKPIAQMRGIANDFETPADMRAALPMPRYQPGEPRITG